MDSNSLKENRIRAITMMYYSQPQIKKAIYDFSKNRESIPRYFEGFGKRPDTFQYEQDIIEQVKRGATSFHCSEEIWKDPLEITNESTPEETNQLRLGWDLLLDIDSPYLEYSKTYTQLLIETLEFHGIENYSIKFSGSKGFHIIVPWRAFPEKIYNQNTRDMFPEWPRIICEYLTFLIQPKLSDKILEKDSISNIAEKTGKQESDLIIRECIKCNRPAIKTNLITWNCKFCKNNIENQEGTYNNRKKPLCPECRKQLKEISREIIYICNYCNTNSKKHSEYFQEKERFATEKLIEADLILVAPRHLFRMPYSLHEKTALASIVINKEEIKNFQITDAKPLKTEIRDYYPIPKENEAKNLLLQALDWKEQKQHEQQKAKENNITESETPEKEKKDFKKIIIPNPTKDLYPPSIAKILDGVKQDGKKRALFILLNYFNSLGVNQEEIEKRISEWNKKNNPPLKEGYIRSQIIWLKRNQVRLPPNYDKDYYSAIGINPTSDEIKAKNPVSYSVRRFLRKQKG